MAYMSQEGYDKLVAEVRRLESVERPKASAAIAEAADKGDLSENSEYDAAKEAQAHLEAKINEMKLTIAHAKIVDTSRLKTDEVQILSKVKITNLQNNKSMTYTIEPACDELGFTPRFKLRDGVRRAIRWFKVNHLL